MQSALSKRLIFLPRPRRARPRGGGCGSDDEGDTAAPAETGSDSTGATETTTEPAELKVALEWFPNPDHVGLYYALENGYFEDENLDVTMKTPSDPSAGLKLVATNKFDLAVYYRADMYFASEQDLPVMAVCSIIPIPLNSVMSTADSKVQAPEDIKGAKIGVAGLPFDDAILETIRQSQGLSEDDIQTVNVGFNLEPALLSGKVDAVIGAYYNIEATSSRSRKPARRRTSSAWRRSGCRLRRAPDRRQQRAAKSDEAYADADCQASSSR